MILPLLAKKGLNAIKLCINRVHSGPRPSTIVPPRSFVARGNKYLGPWAHLLTRLIYNHSSTLSQCAGHCKARPPCDGFEYVGNTCNKLDTRKIYREVPVQGKDVFMWDAITPGKLQGVNQLHSTFKPSCWQWMGSGLLGWLIPVQPPAALELSLTGEPALTPSRATLGGIVTGLATRRQRWDPVTWKSVAVKRRSLISEY